MMIDCRICEVEISASVATFELADGRRIACPVSWFPLVALAPMDERRRFDIDEDGQWIEWPHLGERVTVESLFLFRIPKSKDF